MRIIVPFILGIRFGNTLGLSIKTNVSALTGILLLSIGIHLFISYKTRWIWGIMAFLFFVFLGDILVKINNGYIHQLELPENNYEFEGYLLDNPKQKNKSFQNTIVFTDLRGKRFKSILYTPLDSKKIFKAGDIIKVDTKINAVSNNGNPGEYDYKLYMSTLGIYHFCFASENSITITGNTQRNLRIYAETFRDKLIKIYRSHLKDKDRVALASSLVLGYKNDLDEAILDNFSKSGARHVIAVSGLHVGIIFLIVLYLTFPLKNKSPLVQNSAAIISLWGYAFLTGLSPSVIRATAMFTIYLTGKTLGLKTESINILAFAAFVLLLINPLNIYNIGFQLSFMAMGSLIIFYPRVYPLLKAPNKFLNYFWKLTAVSIAVQIGIFPIVIYYFHQIPVYFLFTNILVIMLAGTTIFLSILLFGLSATPLAFIPAFLLDQTLHLFIIGTEWIANIPFSTLHSLKIHDVQLILLYAALLFISLFLINKKALHLKLAILSVSCLIITECFIDTTMKQSKKMLVYNISNHSVIEFSDKRKNIILGDKFNSYVIKNLQNYHYLTPFKSYERINSGCEFYTSDNLLYRNNLYISFYHLKILHIHADDQLSLIEHSTAGHIDYIIVSNNVKPDPCNLKLDYNKIVIDPSNNYYSIKYWKQLKCIENDRLYIVKEQGAFMVEI